VTNFVDERIELDEILWALESELKLVQQVHPICKLSCIINECPKIHFVIYFIDNTSLA
jgi:hypothetical protein